MSLVWISFTKGENVFQPLENSDTSKNSVTRIHLFIDCQSAGHTQREHWVSMEGLMKNNNGNKIIMRTTRFYKNPITFIKNNLL